MSTCSMREQERTARAGVVLRPGEQRCEVEFGTDARSVGYSIPFGPRAETLAPGHLVAVTDASAIGPLVIWRWYDAVVLGRSAEQVRLWEPNHGEVVGTLRNPRYEYPVGTRAYASAGLPGADWWVEGPVSAVEDADVAMQQVREFYATHDLWSRLS